MATDSYQESIDNIKKLLPNLTDAQARDYATQELILTTTFHQGGFSAQDYVARLQALYNKFAAYGGPTQPVEPTKPNLRSWFRKPPVALEPRRPEPTWPSPFKPAPTLSNYPRLPQSTIPEPKVEYPAPGRPSEPQRPGYVNPYAWRKKKFTWW